MLLSFRFANHRSFRDEQQLNLTPIYGSAGRSDVGIEAVPVVGIFGANASGKSNVLSALWFMRLMATRSDREVEPGLGLNREPFRLHSPCLSMPSRYVVDLHLDGARHTYGFTIDNERVLEEWLYHYPLKKKRRVFERDRDSFTWGEESSKRADLERIGEITAPTALFLSTSARFSQSRTRPQTSDRPDPLHDVYRWFFRIRGRPRAAVRRPLSLLWPELEVDRMVVINLLQAADVGILDVRLKEPIQEPLFPDLVDVEQEPEAPNARRIRELQRRNRQRLQFTHRGMDGDTYFDIADESTGTQQLLDLAIDAASALRVGGTMTVDKIDASLHPMLTAKVIGLFQNLKVNPHRSQLIFTSHDAALLGTFETEEVLRRDQIWFTEKDDCGVSVLYSLSDFKPRKEGENRQRRYLNGNYGAVPDLSSDLFEQALFARGDLDVIEPA